MSDISAKRCWSKYLCLGLCFCLFSFAALEGLLRWQDWADPPAFEDDPSYGFRMRPHQSVSPRGYRFYINSSGFRGKDIIAPKPYGIYRIAFLGESITYGGGSIPDEDLFANQVACSVGAAEGRHVEAINLSVPGWGIQNLAAYVSSAGVFKADLVVWVIPSCDFQRHKTTAEEMGDPQGKIKIRLAYVVQAGWSTLKAFFHALSSRERTDPDSEIVRRNIEVFNGSVTQLKRKGIPVAVVFVPYEWGYRPSADLMKYESAAKSCSIPFLDSADHLLRQRSERLFIDGVHLNIRGHKVLADAISRFIEANFFRPIRTGSMESAVTHARAQLDSSS